MDTCSKEDLVPIGARFLSTFPGLDRELFAQRFATKAFIPAIRTSRIPKGNNVAARFLLFVEFVSSQEIPVHWSIHSHPGWLLLVIRLEIR